MGPPAESRASQRFVPAFSLAASILDRDLQIVHGVVANLSEVGATLLTCRSVDDGTYVALDLRRQDRSLVETFARVVWTWDGVSAAQETSGSLVGVSFCGLSAEERAKIWTCSSSLPRTSRDPGPVPFAFDQLSEPEVDWFIAREIGGRKTIGSRRPKPQSAFRTPPLRPTPRR